MSVNRDSRGCDTKTVRKYPYDGLKHKANESRLKQCKMGHVSQGSILHDAPDSSTKIYHDLNIICWCHGMKKDVTKFVT